MFNRAEKITVQPRASTHMKSSNSEKSSGVERPRGVLGLTRSRTYHPLTHESGYQQGKSMAFPEDLYKLKTSLGLAVLPMVLRKDKGIIPTTCRDCTSAEGLAK